MPKQSETRQPEEENQINPWGLLLMIFSLVGIGTLGYMFIQGWNFLDSLYMVVITLATVGVSLIHI